MNKKIAALALALMLCLGLCGCLETPAETEDNAPVPGMAVVSDGSLSAVVIGKEDDGITLEVSNNENPNTISATFTSAKMGGKEYQINQATYADSPLSIVRLGYEDKTVNLSLPANDFVRIKVSSSELDTADDYNNVDLTYSETYMGDNGTITKTGKTISVKNA